MLKAGQRWHDKRTGDLVTITELTETGVSFCKEDRRTGWCPHASWIERFALGEGLSSLLRIFRAEVLLQLENATEAEAVILERVLKRIDNILEANTDGKHKDPAKTGTRGEPPSPGITGFTTGSIGVNRTG